MQRPLFLLLAYQQQPYVADAVRAALAQEGLALDILISDDCSTDGTFETIKATVAGYDGPHFVTVRRNPRNMGLIEHINLCVSQTDAEVVIAAAGDDVSAPHRARRILAAFNRGKTWLAHSRVELISENGETLPGGMTALMQRRASLADCAASTALYVGATGAWHRSLFDKYGMLPQGVYEDLVLGFRAVLEGAAVFIDEPLVRYRKGIGVSFMGRELNSPDRWREARKAKLDVYARVFEARLSDVATNGSDVTIENLLRRKADEQRLRQEMLGARFGDAASRALSGEARALLLWHQERLREWHGLWERKC